MNILGKYGLSKLEILQNQWYILVITAGVIAIAAAVLILIILRKRKSKKCFVENANLTSDEEHLDKLSGENCEFIIKRIKRFGKNYKSILFASVDTSSLPVTIPVNVAIGLAKNNKRCLLIDADLRRDAVAEAFELNVEESGLHFKAVQTEFENLWVWPGHNFVQSKQMNIKAIVQKALDRFDFILINAPCLSSSPDRRQITSAAQAAFICGKNGKDRTKSTTLIKPYARCWILDTGIGEQLSSY